MSHQRDAIAHRIIQGGSMLGAQSSGTARRPFTCSECHKSFKTRTDLIWHAEACLMEAFESEVMSVLTDVSVVRPKYGHPGPKPTAPAGITVRSLDTEPRQEWIKMKVGTPDAEKPELVAVKKLDPDEHDDYHRHDDVPVAQTIQGPGGLRLMVSVEKERSQDDDDMDEPPILDPEVADDADDDDDEDIEDEDLDEDLDMVATGSSYSAVSQPTPQVIGALANANDDPFKPKMECPTCGLILYRHNFATHYRIHTGELPFACTYCQKRFRTTSSLKVHLRAHTGEKPYHCPQCQYATITKRNLDRHILNHHVKTPILKGPMSRRSRYRDNVELDWMSTDQYDKDHPYVDQRMHREHDDQDGEMEDADEQQHPEHQENDDEDELIEEC